MPLMTLDNPIVDSAPSSKIFKHGCRHEFLQAIWNIIYSTNEGWITTNFNVSNLVPLHVNVPNCNINVDFISHY